MLDPVSDERLFVCLKHACSAGDVLTNGLRVGHELDKLRHASERSPIQTFDKKSRLLELCRKEERSRHHDAFILDACLVIAAGSNLAAPESQATLVRLATEKVAVILANEVFCLINSAQQTNLRGIERPVHPQRAHDHDSRSNYD